MLTMQDALARLATYWAAQGCLAAQPMNTEVGAGTLNPATFLRVLGPEPWRVAYVEPSVRPDDARYGENPNRLQTHTQFQVILKPEPENAQDLYLGSLQELGIDLAAHDVRFVEDNWASPALGAWGLGWEVWLDGLEITQFTYFQQAGGVNLDPVSVEITYGIERILMALQGVQHFKDIVYAEGITYGEVFGQAEYEMSRYYLDDADTSINRSLLELFATEAQRNVDLRLPVPAHLFLLKCSHVFNVLDSRGAVSTADRAAEFARMRRLAAAVAELWIARRAELGHPLGVAQPAAPMPLTHIAPEVIQDEHRMLVFEIGTEEMPPSEARVAREQLGRVLAERLAETRLRHGGITVLATPRRLVAVVEAVESREEDFVRTVRGPNVRVGFDANGQPTPAAHGFARGQGVGVEDLQRVDFNGIEHLAVLRHEDGRSSLQVLPEVLAGTLPIRSAKNMRWRDPKLSFTRPIRWLLALWGDQVVDVTVSSLTANRLTHVLRTDLNPIVSVRSAEQYLETVAAAGIVLDPADRRSQVVGPAQALAGQAGGHIDTESESELIDQISYLVEHPSPLLGQFEDRYLDLPEAVLATVMRKYQRYLPVRNNAGRLMPFFVAVANGLVDQDVVRAGNEAVLRARYEDAAFFYREDLTVPPAEMRDRIRRLTFTDRLGSMHDRAERIGALALSLGSGLRLSDNDQATLKRAAELAKFDLGSQMVTELTSLAGVMAQEYARRAGESDSVAQALQEMELPRQTGDRLPTSAAGALLSLADRLDLLAGLSATVGLPAGSSDPFAIRRAALGLIAVCRSHPFLAAVPLAEGFAAAALLQPVTVPTEVRALAVDFIARRLEQQLVDEGQAIDRVRAVLLHADRPSLVDELLTQLDTLIGSDDFLRLVAALQRARRIVPPETGGDYDPKHLVEPAEQQLHEVVKQVRGDLDGRVDLVHFTAMARKVVQPLETFFDDVFVMVEDEQLRGARLGLLAAVRDLGAGLITWEALRV